MVPGNHFAGLVFFMPRIQFCSYNKSLNGSYFFYVTLPWSLVKSIDQIVNFCLDLLEWLEMLPINPSL